MTVVGVGRIAACMNRGNDGLFRTVRAGGKLERKIEVAMQKRNQLRCTEFNDSEWKTVQTG